MADRLNKEDWIAAGFRALADSGPASLKAEALARRLGTTKGSFYWHFKDVPAFHQAMFDLWESRAVLDIINEVDQVEGAANRLYALCDLAAIPAPQRFGGAVVEPAIRAWALQDQGVAKAVAKVDAGRIAYLAKLLKDAGADQNLALLVYGAYVGLDDLSGKTHPKAPNQMRVLIDLILAAESNSNL